MRIKIILLFILIHSFLNTEDLLNKFNMSLIIIEENQNGEISKDSLITDGIFEAFWEKTNKIFFDMVIEKPLLITNGIPDVSPFLKEAYKTGVDSIIIIRINYSITEENNQYKIKLEEVNHNIYSLPLASSLSCGKKNFNYSEVVDKNKKNNALKNLGIKIVENMIN